MVGLGKININVKFQDNKLDIKILNCQNLKNKEMMGKSDPYVTLFVLPGKHTQLKTKTISGNLNPVYNSTFSFTLSKEQAARKTAVFQVFDSDYGKDDKMGEARIALRDVNLVSGSDTNYSLDLNEFTTSPPVVTATSGSIPRPVVDNQTRPRISQSAGVVSGRSSYHSSTSGGQGFHHSSGQVYQSSTATTTTTTRQSYHSSSGLDIRDLNSRLDEIIRKNGSFHNISDDLMVRLISKNIKESLPEEDINNELNRAFAYTSDEIRELARLRAENEKLEVEVEYLTHKIQVTDQIIQTIQAEEASLDKLIMSCSREVNIKQTEIDRCSKPNYGLHDGSYEGKLMEYQDRLIDYYTWFYEKDIVSRKKELVDRMMERKLKVFVDRSIQSPSIIWGIRKSYSEDFKIRLDNMNMEIQPFRGILNDIIVRYNDFIRPLATCEEQEREFRSLYDELMLREKDLFGIRQERANLRFDRDRNLFNFLAEFAAKEAALAFLKREWDLIVNRAWEAVGGYINQSEINRYCDNVQRADNNAESIIRHYQSTTTSNITGVKLRPQMGNTGDVVSWSAEPIYA